MQHYSRGVKQQWCFTVVAGLYVLFYRLTNKDKYSGVVANELEFQSSLFNVDILNLLLKKKWWRDRKPNVIAFVIWSTLIVGGWGWWLESESLI